MARKLAGSKKKGTIFMEKKEQRRKRAVALAGLGLVIVFMIVVFWFVGKPML